MKNFTEINRALAAKNTNPNSRVLHMAHILHTNRPDFQWSDMVRYAWYFHRFREALKAGVVTFSFFKEDGSIREAKGTLNGVLIPAEDLPSSDCHPKHPTKESYSSVAFYDIDKKGWRAFNICRFIGFVRCYRVEEKERVIKESSKEN